MILVLVGVSGYLMGFGVWCFLVVVGFPRVWVVGFAVRLLWG